LVGIMTTESDLKRGNRMTLPNFLIIGAMKAGTTSLYYYLQEHPQVYMSPVKEPRFFAYGGNPGFRGPGDDDAHLRVIHDFEEYQKLFQAVQGEIAIGEASVQYLVSPQAAERIHQLIPTVKLVVIFRQPAERAFSNYAARVRRGREWLSFVEALEQEQARISQNWHPVWFYRQNGYYATQFKRYLKRFQREQIRIYLYEDLQTDPLGMMQDMYRFLGVDHVFVPNVAKHYNVGSLPRNKSLNRFLTQSHSVKTWLKPMVPVSIRRRLVAVVEKSNMAQTEFDPNLHAQLTRDYRQDILELQDLIGRDLGTWLENTNQ
jgi:hypothetical protein